MLCKIRGKFHLKEICSSFVNKICNMPDGQCNKQILDPNEIWKWVVTEEIDYSDYYEISNYGRIRSVNRTITYQDGRSAKYKGRVLKNSKHPTGVSVTLCISGDRQSFQLSRLVYAIFVNKEVPLNLFHKDGDIENNAAINLTDRTGINFSRKKNKYYVKY